MLAGKLPSFIIESDPLVKTALDAECAGFIVDNDLIGQTTTATISIRIRYRKQRNMVVNKTCWHIREREKNLRLDAHIEFAIGTPSWLEDVWRWSLHVGGRTHLIGQ